MFTLIQLKEIIAKVRSGTDFMKCVESLKDIGVLTYDTFVNDGHTEFYDGANRLVASKAKYDIIPIADQSNQELLISYVKKQGKVSYNPGGEEDTMIGFCKNIAEAGAEKWTVDLQNATCTYFDKSGNGFYDARLEWLYRFKESPILKEIDIQTDLHHAVGENDIEKVKQLLEEGADPNHKLPLDYYYPNISTDDDDVYYGYQPYTPLRLVVFCISDSSLSEEGVAAFGEITKILLENGAYPKPAIELAIKRYGDYEQDGELYCKPNTKEFAFRSVLRIIKDASDLW